MQERPQDASLNFNLKPFRPLSRPKEQSNIPVRPLDRSMEGLEMESEEFNNSIRRHRGRFARWAQWKHISS